MKAIITVDFLRAKTPKGMQILDQFPLEAKAQVKASIGEGIMGRMGDLMKADFEKKNLFIEFSWKWEEEKKEA